MSDEEDCFWTNVEGSMWEAECQYNFEFDCGLEGPLGNGFRFCPNCGKSVVIAIPMTISQVKKHVKVEGSVNVYRLPTRK